MFSVPRMEEEGGIVKESAVPEQPKFHTNVREQAPPETGILNTVLILLANIFVIVTFPISICFCLKVVNEYERAVIFRLGRCIAGGAQGPGIFFVNPCIDEYIEVDYRTISFDVPPQELLTKDHVSIAVDAVVYYRVVDAVMSVINIDNYAYAVKLLGASILRNNLGTRELSEVLTAREDISNQMLVTLDEATDPWGIKVERVEIKDVRLPQSMQRAMAAEAEASRSAKAKVIEAEGEQLASLALRDAADVMMKSPAAIQLRYLQTLTNIAAERNSTIIFPVPISFINKFA